MNFLSVSLPERNEQRI